MKASSHDIFETKFEATKNSGKVSAILMKPRDTRWLFVLGHGAGAGMRHPFMESIARKLASRRIATFRYQFPYIENRTRRPDPKPVIMATVRSAVEAASKQANNLSLFLGGKSFGGRMASNAMADREIAEVRALIFLGFPLHPPGAPSTERAEHLSRLNVPILFLQGTRDKLADLKLLRPVCKKLGSRATLHVVEGADHSFHVLKSSGRSDDDVLEELAETTEEWVNKILIR